MCDKRISIYPKVIASIHKSLNEMSTVGIESFATPNKMEGLSTWSSARQSKYNVHRV